MARNRSAIFSVVIGKEVLDLGGAFLIEKQDFGTLRIDPIPLMVPAN